MRLPALAGLVLCLVAVPGQAQASRLNAAMLAGVHACQEWVLEPRTWADDPSQFGKNIGLQDELVQVMALPPGVLPEELVSSATNYWHIDAGDGNGIFVAASVRQPLCNVVGGGPSDYQPDAADIVDKTGKNGDWSVVDDKATTDMASTSFKSSTDPHAEMLISRAAKPNERTDRVQFLATVFYQTGR